MTEISSPLLCSCGRPGELPSIASQPWSRFAGYGPDGVFRFCADQDEAKRDRDIPALLSARPKVGDRHWARVTHPFVVDDAAFWTTFEPPIMALDEPHQDGQELTEWAIVQCRLLGVDDCLSTYGGRNLAANVEVLQVLTLEDLANGPLAPDPVSGHAARRLVQDDFCLDHLGGSIHQGPCIYTAAVERECDGGQWSILRRMTSGYELLAYGYWGYHYDHIWAGRVTLTDLPPSITAWLQPPPKPVIPSKSADFEAAGSPKISRSWLGIGLPWPRSR